MIDELCLRRNRSLSLPSRGQRQEAHRGLAAPVLFDGASLDAPKNSHPVRQGWQCIGIADPSATDDRRASRSLACGFEL
jgi:hypothetical protein